MRGSPRQVPVGAVGVSVQGMAGPCDTWRMSGHQCSVACCESAVGRWRHVCGVGRAWSSGEDTWCDGKVESAAFESERVRYTMNSQSYTSATRTSLRFVVSCVYAVGGAYTQKPVYTRGGTYTHPLCIRTTARVNAPTRVYTPLPAYTHPPRIRTPACVYAPTRVYAPWGTYTHIPAYTHTHPRTSKCV